MAGNPQPTADSEPSQPAFEFWDFPDEAAVREPPPASISDADKSRLEGVLRAGTDSSTADGDELFIILGLDFGTSSTKMVVRLPTRQVNRRSPFPLLLFAVATMIRTFGRQCSGCGRTAAFAPTPKLER